MSFEHGNVFHLLVYIAVVDYYIWELGGTQHGYYDHITDYNCCYMYIYSANTTEQISYTTHQQKLVIVTFHLCIDKHKAMS